MRKWKHTVIQTTMDRCESHQKNGTYSTNCFYFTNMFIQVDVVYLFHFLIYKYSTTIFKSLWVHSLKYLKKIRRNKNLPILEKYIVQVCCFIKKYQCTSLS